jgi:hypothetical protein
METHTMVMLEDKQVLVLLQLPMVEHRALEPLVALAHLHHMVRLQIQ